MKRTPKILHIDNSVSFTGAFKALLGICENTKGSFDSVVALPEKSACFSYLNKLGIRSVSFPFRELRKSAAAVALYVPTLFMNAIRLARFIGKEGIDIVHNNDHFNLVPVVAKLMPGRKFKLVVHVRLLPGAYNHQLYAYFRKINLAAADRLIGVSEAARKAYGNPGKMDVVYDKIVLHEKHPPFSERHDGKFRFLFMANYIQGKGQDHALAAFTKIAAELPHAELHFYGGTMGLEKNENYRQALAKEAEANRLQHHVFFHGFADDTEAVYKAHDCSLCFSESESFSLVCIESMFFGIPVIASACGGPEEIIEPGVSGSIVPNKDRESMAAAMLRIANDSALRSKFRLDGRQRVEQILDSPVSFTDVLTKVIDHG